MLNIILIILRRFNFISFKVFKDEFLLKGQCHKIFCFRFFSWITFPQAPENNIRVISNFFLRNARCTTGVNDTVAKLPLVSTTPAANFPPVSTTSAANLPPALLVLLTPVTNLPPHQCQQYQRKICSRCQLRWWHIMGTLSGRRHLKVNLKVKIYICVNSYTQRCPNRIIKIFWLKIFFICHRCQWHWWCTLNCEYLPELLKKFETALMVY